MTSSETPYHFEKFDGVSVIVLLSELNDVPWADIESIGSTILEQMETQTKPLFLIDLDALTYMGSAMVALVVRLWKSVKTRNGKIARLCRWCARCSGGTSDVTARSGLPRN